jgi:5-hydroxyisourate hydrolase
MLGAPAANVEVILRRQVDGEWHDIAAGRTDGNGTLTEWQEAQLPGGTYQLNVDIDGYYTALGTVALHPRATVEFRVVDPTADLLLPLLLTPSSFQVYRAG